jgi:hypothetical protein
MITIQILFVVKKKNTTKKQSTQSFHKDLSVFPGVIPIFHTIFAK